IAEAYEELAPHIKAIETGLSSDPAMNRRVADLDNVAIISNSDAHSPQKLGREATVVQSELSYQAITGAIKNNDKRLLGTIEFFPEEGKYHHDGHRACNVRFTPDETKAHNGMCPVCGKPLVVGVENRLNNMATRPQKDVKNTKRVEYIIPLPEILAELAGAKSTAGKAVQATFHDVIDHLGNEFDVLRNVPPQTIRDAGFPMLAIAIERLRAGNVVREPGYDGVFGTIKVFKDTHERQDTLNQLSLL
ncbi:MAG TPA: endonuclease Q family protein, partial [Candidatus Saccharimonadales bacterium]|nr:endonuclease Q family protein [Candidatus Saccharimonadales bacterium]